MKIPFTAYGAVSDSDLARFRKYSHWFGFPEVGSRPVSPNLAIIGGGPSINDNIERIKAFDGEIWAINGAFQWCRKHNIDATFYAIDGRQVIAEDCMGATRAVLSDTVHPRVFGVLRNADIELAKIGKDAILHDTTAASSAPMIAAHRGHVHLTFFGCESSFSEQLHAYDDENVPIRLWVQCGGREYTTTPQLIMQAEFLASMARALPEFITVDGDGLLPSLVEHGDYDVTHVCRALDEQLRNPA